MRFRHRASPVAVMLAALLTLAAVPARAACFEGASERLVVEVLFGRNIGPVLGVSDQAFARFLDQEVTPRFPDGFTVLDMYGQYRGSGAKTIIREPGKYLVIALGDETRDVPLVREVVEAYKREFKQQSVGILAHPACVSF